ncbi:hypothetical protein GRI89_09485 [Altererythrobacter salegens]|uniref:Uncharacterized protein n=1 Tax=Croceibacterium salegens TaxID=1737568 RepID=A0A6I4SXB5_9SPHN|nr:hypothetical protein [Croceibacterium salegens]MXO59770.1 hypothetical protein [Croceibacterium salegens]
MKFTKTTLTSLVVAAGLVAAPLTAQAAEARQPSAVSQSEQVSGGGFLAFAGLIAAAIGLIIVLTDDGFDASDLPASP